MYTTLSRVHENIKLCLFLRLYFCTAALYFCSVLKETCWAPVCCLFAVFLTLMLIFRVYWRITFTVIIFTGYFVFYYLCILASFRATHLGLLGFISMLLNWLLWMTVLMRVQSDECIASWIITIFPPKDEGWGWICNLSQTGFPLLLS